MIGAFGNDSGAIRAGSAYVYDLSGGTAILAESLHNPTPAHDDWFGLSVSVSGDTVVVGAAGDDTAASNAGSSYVYQLSGASAILTGTLISPAPMVFSELGNAVAVSGDTVVVGASRDDTGGRNSGRVHVYDLSSGIAVLTATINNPTPAAEDRFGISVSISGDTIVVGAYSDNSGTLGAGTV